MVGRYLTYRGLQDRQGVAGRVDGEVGANEVLPSIRLFVSSCFLYEAP